jgi:hypothetical protein
MMKRMKLRHRTLRLYGTAMTAALPFILPTLALARPTEDETATLEARLEGYKQTVALADPGSTALSWILLIILAILAVAVMFKDARRSHLD